MTISAERVNAGVESADTWSIASAKAHFSEVLERARTEGPQTVTRHGQPAAVVVSLDEWQRKTKRVGTLAEFFASSPLRDVPDLELPDRTSSLRDTEL